MRMTKLRFYDEDGANGQKKTEGKVAFSNQPIGDNNLVKLWRSSVDRARPSLSQEEKLWFGDILYQVVH